MLIGLAVWTGPSGPARSASGTALGALLFYPGGLRRGDHRRVRRVRLPGGASGGEIEPSRNWPAWPGPAGRCWHSPRVGLGDRPVHVQPGGDPAAGRASGANWPFFARFALDRRARGARAVVRGPGGDRRGQLGHRGGLLPADRRRDVLSFSLCNAADQDRRPRDACRHAGLRGPGRRLGAFARGSARKSNSAPPCCMVSRRDAARMARSIC